MRRPSSPTATPNSPRRSAWSWTPPATASVSAPSAIRCWWMTAWSRSSTSSRRPARSRFPAAIRCWGCCNRHARAGPAHPSLKAVIPGRALLGANPESRAVHGAGFRVCAQEGASRNDEVEAMDGRVKPGNDDLLLLEVFRRRIVARIDRVFQELGLVVGPELADVGIALDHRIDQPAVAARHLSDIDVADRIAEFVELHHAAHGVGVAAADRRHEGLFVFHLAAGGLQRRFQHRARDSGAGGIKARVVFELLAEGRR